MFLKCWIETAPSDITKSFFIGGECGRRVQLKIAYICTRFLRCKLGKYHSWALHKFHPLPVPPEFKTTRQQLKASFMPFCIVPKAYSLNPDTYFIDSKHASFADILLKFAFISLCVPDSVNFHVTCLNCLKTEYEQTLQAFCERECRFHIKDFP